MNRERAKKTAQLINTQNKLPAQITSDDVMYGKYFIIQTDPSEDGSKSEIVSCVRAKRQSFFSLELKHLSVNPSYVKRGLGTAMVKTVERYAVYENIPVVCATTCVTNAPANSLFTKLGYTNVTCFKNAKTGNLCNIWQKIVIKN